jgi:hypothetical protein
MEMNQKMFGLYRVPVKIGANVIVVPDSLLTARSYRKTQEHGDARWTELQESRYGASKTHRITAIE